MDNLKSKKPPFNKFKKDSGHGRYSKNEKSEIEDGFVVVGKKPVLETLRSQQEIDKLLLMKDNKDHVLKELADKAKKRGIVVQSVDKARLEGLSEGRPHQGCVAILAPFPYSELQDIYNKAKEKGEAPFVVVLDHLTDPHNLGAIIRSANICGAHGVIIPKRRAAGLTVTAVKASSGAVVHTPIVKVTNLAQCLKELKENGFWVMSADMDGENYYDLDYKGKLALVIGSEGKGVGEVIKKESDYLVSIPLYGDIESFNASAAAAIILSEAARKRH